MRSDPLDRPLTPSCAAIEGDSLIIAIDGPAASGKSTTAKLVADRLGYTYIDSGAMYRAVALKALRLGIAEGDHEALARAARESSIELPRSGDGPVLLDGEDVTSEIRTELVTAAASVISTVPGVRSALVSMQRAFGHTVDCVMEGRDIGTVVFPGADLKIFLIADIAERACRRLHQMTEQGLRDESDGKSAETVLREFTDDIAARDDRDSTRKDSPLRKADDAVELDTTGMSIEQQVEAVVRLAVERGAVRRPNDKAVRE